MRQRPENLPRALARQRGLPSPPPGFKNAAISGFNILAAPRTRNRTRVTRTTSQSMISKHSLATSRDMAPPWERRSASASGSGSLPLGVGITPSIGPFRQPPAGKGAPTPLIRSLGRAHARPAACAGRTSKPAPPPRYRMVEQMTYMAVVHRRMGACQASGSRSAPRSPIVAADRHPGL